MRIADRMQLLTALKTECLLKKNLILASYFPSRARKKDGVKCFMSMCVRRGMSKNRIVAELSAVFLVSRRTIWRYFVEL